MYQLPADESDDIETTDRLSMKGSLAASQELSC